MCSHISISFLCLFTTIASINSASAAPVTSNSTFQEQPNAVKYKPVNVTSNRVFYNVLYNLDQIEIYVTEPHLGLLLLYTGFSINMGKGNFSLFVQNKHCKHLETIYGVSVSETQANEIDQAMGFVPGKNTFSNEVFEAVLVDTDNNSYFAAVAAKNVFEPVSILFVATKEVSPQMDVLRRNKIFELVRDLNFSPKPWAVSNRRDCKNLLSGTTEKVGDVEGNEDDDSDEV